MKREEYRKFQWLASVCIAVFILSFAVCLLAFNRSVYRLSSTDYRNGATVEISKAEAELYYGQIADSYCRFLQENTGLPDMNYPMKMYIS